MVKHTLFSLLFSLLCSLYSPWFSQTVGLLKMPIDLYTFPIIPQKCNWTTILKEFFYINGHKWYFGHMVYWIFME